MESEWSKSFDSLSEVIDDPLVREEVVKLSNVTVGRFTIQPGWRWSEHVKPRVGTDWCEARHVGVSTQGLLGIRLQDGTEYTIEAGQVFVIPAGHDIWVIGDEPAQSIEWAGALAWHPGPESFGDRLLATLLMSDIVGSTSYAESVGESKWRALLSEHDQTTVDVIHSFRGSVIKGTGDGALAIFRSARNAVLAGRALTEAITPLGFSVRVGVTTGEVDLVADDVHGVTVHELARITDLADADEVLVSQTTALLSGEGTARFTSKGSFELRGVKGTHELFAAIDP